MNERYIIDYLSSPEWKAKRKAVKKRCGDICERCHLYLVDEVHHLTYERVYNESLEDLQGLCAGCHEFLHDKTGIDPLKPSTHVTVSQKVIQFWDSQAEKFRRVKRANSQLGQFAVPRDVFLDEQGKPILDPSRWERYRVADWIGNRWYSLRRSSRGRKSDLEWMEVEAAEQKKRKELEEKRLQKKPERYTSFEHAPPKTSKQIKALFKKYPRVVDHGSEWALRNVRETKTMGVVLDLQHTTTRGWSLTKIYLADWKLAEGKIVLDRDRNLWVVRD